MRLYALCDQELLDKRNISLLDFIKLAKDNNAEIIQYRNKKSDISFIKQQLIKIRNNFDGALIVNDAYELAEFCDGIHLGQEDLQKIDENIEEAITFLRKTISNDKIIGISTHNKEEIVQANGLDVNYIGLGAYRDTSTKTDISLILGDGVDRLASISKHPVGVIGGVRMDDKFENITYLVIGSGLIK
ncbi:MAG: thiamine phosphate synthase [Campylobacterota bacterium]|nr:thiamine phosphate synthase [Campylobacterota bacterium]